jgi:hypothetical protein
MKWIASLVATCAGSSRSCSNKYDSIIVNISYEMHIRFLRRGFRLRLRSCPCCCAWFRCPILKCCGLAPAASDRWEFWQPEPTTRLQNNTETVWFIMQHGEIFMIKELQGLHDPWRKCVRVTGTVQSVDIHKKICLLYHKGKSVLVDISLIDPAIPRLDTLCQFIGEIRESKQVYVCTTKYSPPPP